MSDRPQYDHYRDFSQSRGPLTDAFARQILATTRSWLPRAAAECDVLDVGSGYGGTAMSLARDFRSVVALEPAEHLHRTAVDRAAELTDLAVDFRWGGVEQLAEVEAYDLVVLDNVYEHLPDHERALEAVTRALRPGGVLYLLVPNKLWPIEAHYSLPFLSWLPLSLANRYLRLARRGSSYEDASYAPTYWQLRRALRRRPDLTFEFVLPGDPGATVAGAPWHYRLGMALLRRFPPLWAVSKALLVVAVKRGERQSSPSENADSRSWRE
jgi:SAM-dependent methyltransferase